MFFLGLSLYGTQFVKIMVDMLLVKLNRVMEYNNARRVDSFLCEIRAKIVVYSSATGVEEVPIGGYESDRPISLAAQGEH
jgi:hypothetical protein